MPMHARTVPTSKTPAELWSMGEDEITVAIIKPDAVGMPWTEELPADAEAGEGEEPVDGGGDEDEEGGSNGGSPKVDVVAEDKAEAIVERARTEGFEVVRSMRLRMSKAQAQAFYEGRASEEETDFMSSGPVVVLLLRKKHKHIKKGC